MKFILIILCVAFLFCGCASPTEQTQPVATNTPAGAEEEVASTTRPLPAPTTEVPPTEDVPVKAPQTFCGLLENTAWLLVSRTSDIETLGIAELYDRSNGFQVLHLLPEGKALYYAGDNVFDETWECDEPDIDVSGMRYTLTDDKLIMSFYTTEEIYERMAIGDDGKPVLPPKPDLPETSSAPLPSKSPTPSKSPEAYMDLTGTRWKMVYNMHRDTVMDEDALDALGATYIDFHENGLSNTLYGNDQNYVGTWSQEGNAVTYTTVTETTGEIDENGILIFTREDSEIRLKHEGDAPVELPEFEFDPRIPFHELYGTMWKMTEAHGPSGDYSGDEIPEAMGDYFYIRIDEEGRFFYGDLYDLIEFSWKADGDFMILDFHGNPVRLEIWNENRLRMKDFVYGITYFFDRE